jgi:kynurenine formamidase
VVASAWPNRPRPYYAELPAGNARGVFGPDDQLGCLNLLTCERTAAAAALVRTGELFSLNASLMNYNVPNFFASRGTARGAPKHTVIALKSAKIRRDDYLDAFYPQAGSQWDHFRHCGDPDTETFYNGHTDATCGIDAWAERGIAGRGVLLDVARWTAEAGDPIDWLSPREITVADLERTAAAQRVSVEEGTILLMRVGWQEGYSKLTPEERAALPSSSPSAPGLEPSPAIAERLWDWGIAAIGSDNPQLEVYSSERYSILHDDLLGRLGIPIGEFWLLDALAAACAAQKRYEFLFTSAPLNVAGGVGSTANALAII